MFGKHKMTHSGTAEVLACDDTGMVMSGNTGYDTSSYTLILDVRPDGAPPFRAETKHRFTVFRAPTSGVVLKVRCNPDTREVAIDVSEDPRFKMGNWPKEQKAAEKARRERLLAGAPGTPIHTDEELAATDPELAELLKVEALERESR